MKTTKYILLGLVAMIGATSCEDSLDRYPKDKLSPETFFSNEKECELFTNDFYTLLPGGSTIYGETADIISKQTLISAVMGNRTIPSTSSTWTWTKLRDINFFLEKSANCDDERVRAKYDAVARFFRAFFYFEKVKNYGDVPWVDQALDASSSELYKGRDSRQYVIGKIIEDLDYAIKNLDATRDIYRVTSWTAMALKSRVCLFEGTYRKYHGLGDYEDLLKQCAEISQRFVNESGYAIYNAGATPYQDLFSAMTSNTSEIILSRAYNATISLKHDVNNYLVGTTMGKPGLLKNIVNMYLMSDGTRFTDKAGWETMNFAQECANRDKRLAQTIRTPGFTRIGETSPEAPNLAACETGYQLIKYLQSKDYDGYEYSCNDLPLFRTAEVYLNLAEAKAELGTLSQNDIDLVIKPLRDRAGLPNLDMASANSNPDAYLSTPGTGYINVTGDNKGVILEIRRERTVELLMENLRYWDIMRWKEGKRFENVFTGMYFPGEGSYDLDGNGTVDVCLWTGTKPTGTGDAVLFELGREMLLTGGQAGNILLHTDYQRHWDEDKDYLYPVPTDDRVLTQGAISQNPGWDDHLNY